MLILYCRFRYGPDGRWNSDRARQRSRLPTCVLGGWWGGLGVGVSPVYPGLEQASLKADRALGWGGKRSADLTLQVKVWHQRNMELQKRRHIT